MSGPAWPISAFATHRVDCAPAGAIVPQSRARHHLDRVRVERSPPLPIGDPMPETDPSVKVLDNAAGHRYEAFVGGQLAGFITYRARPGAVVLVHTEVNKAFEGHGVGGRLAAAAFEDARAR